MIRANSGSNCVHGRLYYYDFLEEQTREHIPQSALHHIVHCGYCQSEIERLRGVLGKKDGPEQEARRARTAAVSSILKLHFAYVGRSVTCNEARALLPSLADPALKVRIPTPITVHVDNCRACSEDVSTIRAMGLSHKQLCRLGQVLADRREGRGVDCRQASEFVQGVAKGDLRRASAEVLKHLCTCRHCRQVVYERREEVLAEMLADGAGQSELSCEEVPLKDLFEYCMPYGIEPGNVGTADLQPETAAHVSSCPKCLARVQSMHKTICGAAQREPSSVATRFTFQGQEAQQADFDPAASAGDWAVNVELYKLVPEPQTPSKTVGLELRPKQAKTRLNLTRLVRPVGIAAAAMLLISVFFLNAPAARAVDLGQVYAALAKIKDVCITSFYAGKTEPYLQEWVSQTMNIRMFRSEEENEFVLWDMASGVKKARSFDSDTIEATEPSAELLKRCRDAVANSFGLMPFATLADVPEDAQWTWVDDAEATALVPGTEVYDLTWVNVDNGGRWARRKRYWVDRRTGLPKRAEVYRTPPSGSEYLIMTVEFGYPTDSEIQGLIKGWFGEDSLP